MRNHHITLEPDHQDLESNNEFIRHVCLVFEFIFTRHEIETLLVEKDKKEG